MGRRAAGEYGQDVVDGQAAHGVDGFAGLRTEVRGDDHAVGEVVGEQR